MIWWDGQGTCLFSKRLERSRFVWPSASEGKVSVTPAQLSMLLEGIVRPGLGVFEAGASAVVAEIVDLSPFEVDDLREACAGEGEQPVRSTRWPS